MLLWDRLFWSEKIKNNGHLVLSPTSFPGNGFETVILNGILSCFLIKKHYLDDGRPGYVQSSRSVNCWVFPYSVLNYFAAERTHLL